MLFDEFGYAMNPPEAFQPRAGRGSMRLHGGKGGSSAPPPDPRLAQAQLESVGLQRESQAQMMSISRELLPLQKQQMQDSIDRGSVLYGQSQDDRAYGLQRRDVLTGLQDQAATDASSFNTADRREQMAGQAQADVTDAYDNAQSMQSRGLERSGVNVNSGQYQAMINSNNIARAASSATAANKTRQAALQEGFQLNDRASNAFAGYPASTASSVGMGLNTAGFGLASANSGLAGMNLGFGAAGTMAGQMGSNATGMYGAQATYKSQQDQIARQQSDPMGAILGKGLGAFATQYGTTLAGG